MSNRKRYHLVLSHPDEGDEKNRRRLQAILKALKRHYGMTCHQLIEEAPRPASPDLAKGEQK